MSESIRIAGLDFFSHPFFSSNTGYKLQASLFLNGNGGGDNTHVSLYIKLLPGPHDCILRWPFRNIISFTLLDQTTDKTSKHFGVFLSRPVLAQFQQKFDHQRSGSIGLWFSPVCTSRCLEEKRIFQG